MGDKNFADTKIKFGGYTRNSYTGTAEDTTTTGAMIVLLTEGDDHGELGEWGKKIDEAANGVLKTLIKDENFEAKAGEFRILPKSVCAEAGTKYDFIMAVGVGTPENLTSAWWDDIGRQITHAAQNTEGYVTVMVEETLGNEHELPLIAARIGLGAYEIDRRFDNLRKGLTLALPKTMVEEARKAFLHLVAESTW